MRDKLLIQLPEGTTETEMKRFREDIHSAVEGYDVLITTSDVSITEFPALDQHIEEIATRVAEKLK